MRVEANGSRLWFDVDGPAVVPEGPEMRERPTVLLLHGGPGSFDHSYFKPDFVRLAEVAQVVYLDLPGHGRSEHGDPARWTFESCADGVRDFCQAVGLERPVVFGHSLGGMVAMVFAARYPDVPGALVVQSAPGRFDVPRLVEELRKRGGDEVAATAERAYGGDGESVTPTEWSRCWALFGPHVIEGEERARTVPNPELNVQALPLLRGFDVLDQVGAIACPTLVCAASSTRSCRLTPRASSSTRFRVPAWRLSPTRDTSPGRMSLTGTGRCCSTSWGRRARAAASCRAPRTKEQPMAHEELKQRQSAMWGNGPYQRITETLEDIHDLVIERLDPSPGDRWLDLATGTGAIAERAASAGASVTGIDLAPVLIETAKERARAQGLDIDYRVGDAEALDLPDASFEKVSSTLGIMFAPDHEAVARELARVTAPGGNIALANWTLTGGLGKMFKVMAPYQPAPPPSSPFDWGDEARVRELLGDDFELEFEERVSTMRIGSGEEYWELFTTSYGPTRTLVESIGERREDLRRDWVEFFETNYRSDGEIVHTREYLMVSGIRR